MELIQLPPSTSPRVQLFSQEPGKSLYEPLSVTALPSMYDMISYDFMLESPPSLAVFFCDSLDLCYDPCHVMKHES